MGAAAGPARALPTTKAVVYASFAAGAVLVAVVAGNPAVIGLGAPFAFALALGLFSAVPPAPSARLAVDADRVTEGAMAILAVKVQAVRPISGATASIALPEGLDPGDAATAWPLELAAGAEERFEVPLVATRFGRYRLGPLEVRIDGPFGCRARTAVAGEPVLLEALPQAEPVRTVVHARTVRATAGDQLARRAGDGIEFAEVRPFVPGGPGRLNWRVTARRGTPHVNLRTPERSTDVVVLVDTFSEPGLPRQVRAAAALAGAHLRRHDRVGLVSFGGVMHWVEPAMGRPQLERLVSALAGTEWYLSYAWKTAESIPARMLPRTALVVALTPLDDQRVVHALGALRARGVDLAVIETAEPGAASPDTPAGRLARRILELEREELRGHFARRGVPVVPWAEGEPLEVVLATLASWRRRAGARTAR